MTTDELLQAARYLCNKTGRTPAYWQSKLSAVAFGRNGIHARRGELRDTTEQKKYWRTLLSSDRRVLYGDYGWPDTSSIYDRHD